MLDKPIDEIVYEDGKVVGVKSQGEVGLSWLTYTTLRMYCIHACTCTMWLVFVIANLLVTIMHIHLQRHGEVLMLPHVNNLYNVHVLLYCCYIRAFSLNVLHILRFSCMEGSFFCCLRNVVACPVCLHTCTQLMIWSKLQLHVFKIMAMAMYLILLL